jgi:hypothetical protein
LEALDFEDNSRSSGQYSHRHFIRRLLWDTDTTEEPYAELEPPPDPHTDDWKELLILQICKKDDYTAPAVYALLLEKMHDYDGYTRVGLVELEAWVLMSPEVLEREDRWIECMDITGTKEFDHAYNREASVEYMLKKEERSRLLRWKEEMRTGSLEKEWQKERWEEGILKLY